MGYKQLHEEFQRFCIEHKIDSEKYFLKYADARCGKRIAIMQNLPSGGISLVKGCEFYTYSELVAWMQGYYSATTLDPFNKIF